MKLTTRPFARPTSEIGSSSGSSAVARLVSGLGSSFTTGLPAGLPGQEGGGGCGRGRSEARSRYRRADWMRRRWRKRASWLVEGEGFCRASSARINTGEVASPLGVQPDIGRSCLGVRLVGVFCRACLWGPAPGIAATVMSRRRGVPSLTGGGVWCCR